MAKVAFSKLGCKISNETTTIKFNDIEIEIKKYLPVDEKLSLIGRVIDQAHDENYNFSNPVKVSVFTELEVIFAYTNLSFTDKQKEDIPKLYDMIVRSGLRDQVIAAIGEEEYNIIYDGVQDSIDSIYKYQNSILGVLNTLRQDYSNLDEQAADIESKLQNPENLQLLKDIISKIG